jgi:hypothetical protein
LKVLRWILEEKDFLNWDNLYIGDIDILLCKEKEDLKTQHLNHCIETKLPYSNCVRPSKDRLSGLHFIKREMYYKKVENTLNKYRNIHKQGLLKNKKNENILYNIVRESGLGFPKKWFRPHHGIHLGLWRQKNNVNLTRIFEDDNYCSYLKYFLEIENTDLYKKVYRITPLKEIDRMKYNLKQVCI